MNYAAIDIGTNAVLLLIMRKEKALEELFDTSTITRLGEGLLQHGSLSTPAMERTVKALENYRTIIDRHHARLVKCFGTSALRDAQNRDKFIRMARERAGVDVRVISEYEEAYYTYLSVKSDPRIEGENLVVVDIGGGSTEIVQGSRQKMGKYASVPIGTVKLTERFITHDPPAEEELACLVGFIREKIPRGEGEGDRTIVGVGGTMTTLAAIVLGLKGFDKEKIHGVRISLAVVDEWITRLGRMSIRERQTVPGMEPGREDVLLQGMILMREIIAAFHGNGVIVSTYGGRYGIIYEALG